VFSLLLSKYLNKNILAVFIVFFLILSLILVGNQFFLVFSQSIKDGLFGFEIFPLILLKFIRDIPFILILSFSLSLIYSLNKLYKNSELTIISTAGVGEIEIIRMIKVLIIPITTIILVITFSIIPIVKSEIFLYKENAKLRPDYVFLKSGSFQNLRNNSTFFSQESKSDENGGQILKNIFIHSRENNKVIISKSGQKILDSHNAIFLELYNGKIYENLNLQENSPLSTSSFEILKLNIFEPNKNSYFISNNNSEHKSIKSLLFSWNNEDIIEFLYRVSIPIMFLIISFISVFLSKVNPRTGKNFSLGYGLILFLAYYNILIYVKKISVSYFENSIVIFSISHLLFFVILLALYLVKQNIIFRKN